jgi:S1-C subfamily serine protease
MSTVIHKCWHTYPLIFLISFSLYASEAKVVRVVATQKEGNATTVRCGSGVPISKNQFITASHVVEIGDITVEIEDKWYETKLVKLNLKHDLALIELKDSNIKVKPFELEITKVKMAGSDDGKEIKEHEGNIYELEVDIHVENGNSGGGLFNSKNKLIGIILRMRYVGFKKNAICTSSFEVEKFLKE